MNPNVEQDYSTGIEQEIRQVMGQAIVTQSRLPISTEEVTYVGTLTIEAYRKLFPDEDNYMTAYLTLNEIQPKLAHLFINVYGKLRDLQAEKEKRLKQQDFEGAASCRSQEEAFLSGLEKILLELPK